uniref:Putative secreted protein n=1 Tax=Anopheles marajoara TaxID=58244 RepID=A0A2M4CDB7_9DIPT
MLRRRWNALPFDGPVRHRPLGLRLLGLVSLGWSRPGSPCQWSSPVAGQRHQRHVSCDHGPYRRHDRQASAVTRR